MSTIILLVTLGVHLIAEPQAPQEPPTTMDKTYVLAQRSGLDYDTTQTLLDLADCESGTWVDGSPQRNGTRRWDYGVTFTHAGYGKFQGGLNFHPRTWMSYKDEDMPSHAGRAAPTDQLVVGARVLADQGLTAWPRCSRLLGYR